MAIDQLTTMKNPTGMAGPMQGEDNSIIEHDDGTMEMYLDKADEPQGEVEGPDTGDFYRNLVPELSDEILEKIGMQVKDDFTTDLSSRSQYDRTITKGLSLLGLEMEELNEPYEGACSAHHPLIIESAVTFQSKASPELLPAGGPVKTQIMGDITDEKEAKAERIKNFLNYQIMCKMPEYVEDTEKMLFWLPIIGSCFKKTYYSATLRRPKSEFVSTDQFVAPYSASSLEEAPRYSHIIYKTENDLRRDMAAGVYCACDEDEMPTPSIPEYSDMRRKMDAILGLAPTSSDVAYTLIEQHTELDMEDTLFEDAAGIALPYIVTIDYGSGKVLSIRRNWKEEDETKQKRMHFVHYSFVPGLGLYGVGFIHLLGNLEMTLTAVLRSLVDSGQFANMQGGFKLKGMRIVGDNQAIAPGEFKEVESAVMDLSKAIMPLQYKEPSQVLFAMLQFLEGAGQKFADKAEQVIQDSTNYGPVGTTLALLEASTKFFTAIHKRCHHSQKKELKLLYDINSETLPEEYPYDVPGQSRTILKSDFDGSVDVIPVSDPNVSSKAQRMTLAQTVMQTAQQFPQLHNLRAAVHAMYVVMGVENIDRILPPEEEAVPNDPLTDLKDAVAGKPIKAFPGQNHDAHMQVKAAFVQDPANGASPFMAAVQPVILANIREHMLLKYQEQIGGMIQQAQQGIPNMDEKVVEQVMAEAAQEILQANQAAAQKPSDPEMMVAQAELMKAQAVAEKVKNEAMNNQVKNSLKAQDQNIKKMEVFQKHDTAMKANSTKLQTQQMKVGADMVKQSLDQQRKITLLSQQVKEAKKQTKLTPIDKKPLK